MKILFQIYLHELTSDGKNKKEILWKSKNKQLKCCKALNPLTYLTGTPCDCCSLTTTTK